MRVSEAISAADELRPGNKVDIAAKRRWLEALDGKIYENIICNHEGREAYTKPSNYVFDDSEMIVSGAHSELYVWYLVSQIDAALGETERYNTSAERYNSLYRDFSASYTRGHIPINNYKLRNVSKVRGI